jgi:hypothetical protein
LVASSGVCTAADPHELQCKKSTVDVLWFIALKRRVEIVDLFESRGHEFRVLELDWKDKELPKNE